MKRIIISSRLALAIVLLTITATVATAQTNPKPGFIITNNGDTVRGVIDFRSNAKLSKQCVFWANGESESQTFKPGDIESFRFDQNGKFFVTRRLSVNGAPQLYFAEFLVQGKMNLYCVADSYDEYFFFEREDGEMAQLTKRAFVSSSTAQDERENQEEVKKQYGKVKLLLKDSRKAIDDMNEINMSRKKLVDIVRDYHRDVCTDGSNCMVYEYKDRADKLKTHIKVFAGYGYYSHERTANQILGADANFSGSTFEMGLGVETDIERLVKGGSLEIGVAYSPKASFERDDIMVPGGDEASQTIYEKSRLTVSLGMVKRFGSGKIQPLVRGGGFYMFHFGNKETRYYRSEKMVDIEWGRTSHYGVYLGAGVQMAVGKYYARLHGDWYKSLESSKEGNMMRWGITAEFAL